MKKNYGINLTMPKKLKGGPFGNIYFVAFFNIHSVADYQKIEGGPFGEKFLKSCTMPDKTERGDSLVSPGNVCYAERRKNVFSLVPRANR